MNDSAGTKPGEMSDVRQSRGRPWTVWVVVVVGLVSNLSSLLVEPSVGNVIVTAIALLLLFGLWRGNPSVRLYFILATFVLLVLNSIALLSDPGEQWLGFSTSVAIFALLLAPPTHRWAQEQERQRVSKKARVVEARLEGRAASAGNG